MSILEKEPTPAAAPAPGGDPIMKVSGLSVTYSVRGRAAGGKSKGTVSAVDGVDLEVRPGETLGLVGESGCGKSTTGRALLGRIPITGGRIEFDGRDITGCGRKQWRSLHRDIQLVFQDPYASLNPRRTVRQIIGEPLVLHKVAKGPELHRAVDELLDMVRLPRAAANRYPHAFSGGQRQRIVIARALALRPRFVVADEPVSALDVSIQAQVVKLLKDLQRDLGLSYLFIAHNLAVIRNIADRVAVMYLGRIVETGDRERIYANPLHPYTKALLSAAPIPDPALERPGRIILSGDPPSAIDPPTGCRFHTRCPLVHDRCRVERPPLVDVEPGHQVACFAVTPSVTPVSVESS
jgi:oligopeptide transport system ATP-binding protein